MLWGLSWECRRNSTILLAVCSKTAHANCWGGLSHREQVRSKTVWNTVRFCLRVQREMRWFNPREGLYKAESEGRKITKAFVPTMVTHDLPGSLHADVLEIVVTAFLVLLQWAALLVASSTVVTLVRFTHGVGPEVSCESVSSSTSIATKRTFERLLSRV